ncbi:MAG TPA: cytochrome c oxidase assembly protein [Microbacteriaceae bacterium]|nr:cytochrome c oxidase assembly protein [Microbacteriaceae bacterium]
MHALAKGESVVFVVAAALGLAAALVFVGGDAVLPPSSQQAAGASTAAGGLGWGLPALTLVACLAAFGLLGSLLSAFRVAPARAAGRLMSAAGLCAAVLTLAGVAAALTAFVEDSGLSPASAQFSAALGSFVTDTGLGRSWLTTTIAAAVVTTLCFAVRQRPGVAFLVAASLVALAPLAGQQYALGSPGREVGAPAAIAFLVGLAVWSGVTAVAPFARAGGDGAAGAADNAFAARRGRGVFVALACFVVFPSGAIAAAVAVGGAFGSKAGVVTLAAAAFLVVAAGTAAARRPAGRIVASAALGLALACTVVLGYVGQPTGAGTATTGASPAQILTGDAVPDAVGPGFFVRLQPDAIWLSAALVAAVLYAAGVMRLRRARVRWPAWRTVLWMAGLVVTLFLTSGGPALYRRYLFSAQLSVLAAQALLVPLLLVPAAPLTLALTVSRLGGKGPTYRALVAGVRSRAAAFLARPSVAGAILAASLWVWLTTRALDWSASSILGHEVCLAWLFAAGYAFVQSLVGRDPAAYRAAYPARLLVLAAVVASGVAFGLFVGLRHGLWAADWFAAMGRTWGLGAVADQQLGGWLFLLYTSLSGLVLALGVVGVWSRSARDGDRQ